MREDVIWKATISFEQMYESGNPTVAEIEKKLVNLVDDYTYIDCKYDWDDDGVFEVKATISGWIERESAGKWYPEYYAEHKNVDEWDIKKAFEDMDTVHVFIDFDEEVISA